MDDLRDPFALEFVYNGGVLGGGAGAGGAVIRPGFGLGAAPRQ